MSKSPLTREQHDVLELLTSELQSHLDVALGQGVVQYNAEYLRELAESVAGFAEAAELIGLHGLSVSWNGLRHRLLSLCDADINEDQMALIDSWTLYFLDYLQQLNEEADSLLVAVNGVVEFLANSAWPTPLSSEEQKLLTTQLTFVDISVDDEVVSRLPKVAESSMISLRITGEINPDLFEGLMLELPAQVTSFAQQIDIYIATKQASALASAQRIAHTLKGSANVVGISGLANFMHFSEDLLEEISRHDGVLSVDLKNLLRDMADTLAAMLDALLTGNVLGSLELSVMQQVLDCYYSIRECGLPVDLDASSTPTASASPLPVSSLEYVSADVQAAAVIPNLQEAIASQLRIKEETAQDLLRLAGESAIATNRLQTQVQDVKEQLSHIGQLHSKLTSLTEEFGQLIEVRELFNAGAKIKNEDGLDPLELDRYNELHSFFHQLQEFAIDTRDAIYQTQGQLRSLEELTYEQQVTNRESQNHLLEMRMIPASSMEARFQRCVRQACRLTGKQARLELIGGDTMIDSRVLHELIDPLMHLLRNAVDHGIEFSEQRMAQGKLTEGLVQLRFRAQGQSIVIQVIDDGYGLNRERIAQKARDLSLQSPSDLSEEMNDVWLKQLIFTAGFSTRDEVSQTSGRGIGLDMVADRVTELKGRISVQSKTGLGCEFTLRLPMTMITEHGLLIASGRHNIAIVARGVEQLLYLNAHDLRNRGDQLQYIYKDNVIDVYHIAQLALLPDAVNINAQDAHALLIVETLPGQNVGILVDRVVSSREMVIKPLTVFTPVIPGVIGATILGDGGIAPVVDVQQLAIDLLQRGVSNNTWMADLVKINQQVQESRPMALVVDDSLSTRRSLAQFVSDIGMDVRTAKDGFEAIEIMQEQLPSIILVDMEMPRMNGLELTAHVRAAQSTKHIPVIMITSRNTEKHRSLAVAAGVDTYVNKPFSEEELLRHIQETVHA